MWPVPHFHSLPFQIQLNASEMISLAPVCTQSPCAISNRSGCQDNNFSRASRAGPRLIKRVWRWKKTTSFIATGQTPGACVLHGHTPMNSPASPNHLLILFNREMLLIVTCRHDLMHINASFSATRHALCVDLQNPVPTWRHVLAVLLLGLTPTVLAVWFCRYRRLFPLVIAHVLYDGLQVGMLLLTYPR